MENRKKVNTDKCVLGNLQKSFTVNRNLIGKNDWLSFMRVRLACVSLRCVSPLCNFPSISVFGISKLYIYVHIYKYICIYFTFGLCCDFVCL